MSEPATELSRLVSTIWQSRQIDRRQQRRLMELILSDGEISSEERQLIDQVWRGITDGRLRAIN